MNISIFSKITLAATLLLTVTSCLDFEPEAQMNDSNVWNKASNFRLFANQFYGYSHDISSAVSDGVHSDFRGDLCCEASLNVYSAGTNSIPESDGDYSGLYKKIYYTNLLLDRAASFANQKEIEVPVAEAKFFRAYLYFDLLQKYGDVILVTKPLDLDDPQLQVKRDDRGIVVDQMVKDLNEAADGLPETPTEAGRLGKDAAYAMLSRVALYEGTWQKFHTNGYATTTNTTRSTELLKIAKEAAQTVMKRNHYKLFYNSTLGTESYRYMFILEDTKCNPAGLTTADNTEYILARRHRLEDGIGINITKGWLTNATFPTRKLANMYLCQDGLPVDKSTKFNGYKTATSEFDNRDNRMLTTLAKNGDKVWNNTADNSRTTWDDTDLNRALTVDVRANSGYQTHKWAVERQVNDRLEAMDFPVIRYAEVLLNYAEAAFEIDGQISDTDLDISLNLVRNRVNPQMVKLSNALVKNNGLSMRDEIRRERTVELVFEGFRIDDLKRWKTAEIEMPMDQVGVLYTGTWFENNWSSQARQLTADGCILLYGDRTWSDKNYLYPLPSDQLQLNPNLGQNPGWDN